MVEEGLGIDEGFWGLIDRGVEVELVDDQATLVRDGKALVEQGTDFSDLMVAEEAVALCSSIGMHTEQVGSVAVVRFDAPAPSAPLVRRSMDWKPKPDSTSPRERCRRRSPRCGSDWQT